MMSFTFTVPIDYYPSDLTQSDMIAAIAEILKIDEADIYLDMEADE